MKRMIQVIMILALGYVSQSFAQDIGGKWTGKMQGRQGAMDIVFDFKVNADTLTGTVTGPMGDLPIINGKIKGDHFSFDVNMGERTMSHLCTAMSDSISMRVPTMQGDTMQVILKRQPKAKE